MQITIKNITTRLSLSTLFGYLAPGESVTSILTPEQAYKASLELQSMIDAGYLSVTMLSDEVGRYDGLEPVTGATSTLKRVKLTNNNSFVVDTALTLLYGSPIASYATFNTHLAYTNYGCMLIISDGNGIPVGATFTITGVNMYGATVVEQIVSPSTAQTPVNFVYTSNSYTSVTNITVDSNGGLHAFGIQIGKMAIGPTMDLAIGDAALVYGVTDGIDVLVVGSGNSLVISSDTGTVAVTGILDAHIPVVGPDTYPHA